MDINKMLAELRAERNRLLEAILTLERLARGQGKRRGRPPKWMQASHHIRDVGATAIDSSVPRKKRKFSAATRKKMAAAQKERWATRGKAAAKES